MISTFFKGELIRHIFKYGLVGVLAFLAEYFSFIYLISAITSPYSLLVAQSVSFGVGLIVSFTGSRLFTFKDVSRLYTYSVSKQISSYIVLAVINFFLSNMAIFVVIQYLFVRPSIAKLFVMTMVVVWNFLLFKKLIFKSK